MLHALADGRTHSGEELARAFGITRAAVWKQVAKLADFGLAVEAAPGAGYRLPRRLDLLAAVALRAALEPSVAARLATLEVFTELESTNERLLTAAPAAGKLDVCIAEFQTAGRGRRGRRWNAPLGSGICLSVGWQFAGMPAELGALTLAVGVAVRRVLARVAGVTIELKWPNDLVFDERKLGGILLEIKAEAHGGVHVVAGVGLNVALPAALLRSLSDGKRSGGNATLSPTPATTCAPPCPSAAISSKMPPSLRSSNTRSLGHLSAIVIPATRSRTRRTATPTASVSADGSAGTPANCQPTDSAMPLPSGACQRRPRRPRPAFWYSAMQTSSEPTGGGAASKRRFVESSSVKTSSFASRAATAGSSAARTASASSRSRPRARR